MSFFYVNPGMVDLFNYFTNKSAVEQINSEIHNSIFGVACTSSFNFGYFFNEVVSEISGCFSLYVSTTTPIHDIFTLSFFNIENESSILNFPVLSLKGYPNGTVLNNSYFPLVLSVGQLNVYSSNDEDKCPLLMSVNDIWFRISVDSSHKAIFQLKINKNKVYSYTLNFPTSSLGNLLLFSMNNASISNIILSSSYDDVLPQSTLGKYKYTNVSNDMTLTENMYVANVGGQKVVFRINNSSNNSYCAIVINNHEFTESNKIAVDIETHFSKSIAVVLPSQMLTAHYEFEINDSNNTIVFNLVHPDSLSVINSYYESQGKSPSRYMIYTYVSYYIVTVKLISNTVGE